MTPCPLSATTEAPRPHCSAAGHQLCSRGQATHARLRGTLQACALQAGLTPHEGQSPSPSGSRGWARGAPYTSPLMSSAVQATGFSRGDCSPDPCSAHMRARVCVCVCVSMWREGDEISEDRPAGWEPIRTRFLEDPSFSSFLLLSGRPPQGSVLPTPQGLHKASTSPWCPVPGSGFRPQGTEGHHRNSVLFWMALVSVGWLRNLYFCPSFEGNTSFQGQVACDSLSSALLSIARSRLTSGSRS